jgi:hypothetical protein
MLCRLAMKPVRTPGKGLEFHHHLLSAEEGRALYGQVPLFCIVPRRYVVRISQPIAIRSPAG